MSEPTPTELHPAVVVDLQEKHEENAVKIDHNTAQLNNWSQFFSTPVGKVIGGAILMIVPLFVTWLSGKMDPKPAPPVVIEKPADKPPVIVNVAPPTVSPSPVVAPVAPTVPVPIKQEIVSPKKIIVYRTKNSPVLGKLPDRVTVDPLVYAKQQMGLFSFTGEMLELQPWTTEADVVSYAVKNLK